MHFSPSDLKSLEVFKAVVEHGGFMGAQVALGLGQPAISFHIKALEDRLGFRLCNRGRGGFLLTDKGAQVYERSKFLFSNISEFESAVGEMQSRISGKLRVGFVENLITDSDFPIYEVIDEFLRRDWDAELEVTVGVSETLITEVGNAGLDVAIIPEMQRYKGLRFTQLYEEKHSLYAARHHPIWDQSSAPDTAAVERYPFVVRPYANLRELQHFRTAPVSAATSNTEAQAMLILSGHYLGYLPDHYAAPWVSRGKLRSIMPEEAVILSPLFMVTRKQKRPSLLAQFFMQVLLSKPWVRVDTVPKELTP